MRGWSRLVQLLIVVLSALGCGKHYHLVPVSGRVTLDNNPLAHAQVEFSPTSGQDIPASIGDTDNDGRYELHLATDAKSRGAVVGENRIAVSLNQGRGKIMPMNRPNAPGVGKTIKRMGELLPAKYNRDSKMMFTVPPEGTSEANLI